jgi:hypothetical protein
MTVAFVRSRDGKRMIDVAVWVGALFHIVRTLGAIMQRALASLILLSCLLWLCNAYAANDLADQLRICAGHSGASERLACFDKVAAAGANGVVAAAPAIAPGAATSGQASVPAPQQPSKTVVAAEPKAITSKVVSIESRAYGRWVATLENSQVWAQNETNSRVKLHPGDLVTIKKGAMGAYQLSGPATIPTYVTQVK